MTNYLSKIKSGDDIELLIRDADAQNKIVAEKVAREDSDTALSDNITNLDERLTQELQDLDESLSQDITDLGTQVAQDLNGLNEDIKSKNYVNIKDYGAYGDNVHDDTQALKDAIDATPVHGTLFIPIGQYLISTVVNITKPITILGEYIGWDVEEASNYVTQAEFRTPLLRSTANGGLHFEILGCAVKNISIRIEGASASYGLQFDISTGVVTTFNRFIIVDNVTVVGMGGTGIGILFTHTGICKISRCHVYGFATGMWFDGVSTTVDISNCWCQNCTSTGYYLETVYYSVLTACACDSRCAIGYNFNKCRAVVINGCGCELTQYGYQFVNCRNCHISGMFVAGSAVSARAINITDSTVSIVGFSIDTVQASASYLYDMVVNDATSKLFIANSEIVSANINGVAKTLVAGDVYGTDAYATL